MIVSLTSAFIQNNLLCPDGQRRIEYVDRGGTGLYIEVRATSPGQGSYYLRYKDANGKTCHRKIGRTTEMELDDARRQARKLKAEITLGADPQAELKAKRSIITFDAFFRDHYLPHAKVHKRTWDKDQERYELEISRRRSAGTGWIRFGVRRSSRSTPVCAMRGCHRPTPITSSSSCVMRSTWPSNGRCWTGTLPHGCISSTPTTRWSTT